MSPNVQAWMAVLARMEAEVARAVAGVAGAAGKEGWARPGPAEEAEVAWVPALDIGPIPPELVQRARDVEAAQQDAVARLEEAKATTARHLAVIQSVRDAKASGHSVFLDVTG